MNTILIHSTFKTNKNCILKKTYIIYFLCTLLAKKQSDDQNQVGVLELKKIQLIFFSEYQE